MTTLHFRMLLALIVTIFYCIVAGVLLLYPLYAGMPVGEAEFVNVYKSYFATFALSSMPGILSAIFTYYFTARKKSETPSSD